MPTNSNQTIKELMAFLWIFIFIFAHAAIAEPDCSGIQKCQISFQEAGCSDLAAIPNMRSKLTTCSELEITQSKNSKMDEILRGCAAGTKKEVLESIYFIASLPSNAVTNFHQYVDQNKISQIYCSENLGYDFDAALDAEHGIIRDLNTRKPIRYVKSDSSKLKKYNECVLKKSAELSNYKLPSLPNFHQIEQFVSELNKMRKCFKLESQSAAICPIFTTAMAGGFISYGVKRVILGNAIRASKAGEDLAVTNKYFDDLKKMSGATKEKFSLSHQSDMFALAESAAIRSQLEKAGINLQQLKMGILDSDAGKLSAVWKAKVLDAGAESDELLNALTGRGQTKASQAMRSLYQKEGIHPILNPELSNDQIRDVLQKNPVLLGYMHEVPGMGSAVSDLNLGKITIQEFQLRIKANMFHNGPHNGFWKILSENIYPGAMKNSSPEAKSFFKNTVFDSGKQSADNVNIPKYPSPISAEGIFHSFVDRLSQGTRGGMEKIFVELAGSNYDKNPMLKLRDIKMGNSTGLDNFKELVIINPEQTKSQIRTLAEHIKEMKISGKLTTDQAKLLDQFTQDGIKRLDAETEFIKKNVRIEPKDGPVARIHIGDKVLDGESSASEALSEISRLMAKEEELHGDPMTQLMTKGQIKVEPINITVGSTVGGLLTALPKNCPISDEKSRSVDSKVRGIQ